MRFINWCHHLFNPHCPHCEAKARCASCETLKVQNDILRAENHRLLDTILNFYKPQQIVEASPRVIEPIKRGSMPWHQRARILEQEERAKARIEIPKPDESVEVLEKELGIHHGEVGQESNTGSS